MEIKQAVVVLADISGYPKFVTLHTMSLLHAEKIITELLEAVIDATSEPLQVNKLEGDAILFYAEAGQSASETAHDVLDQCLAFNQLSIYSQQSPKGKTGDNRNTVFTYDDYCQTNLLINKDVSGLFQ